MQGSVHRLSFFSRHLNCEKNLFIYLPPSYFHREDLYYSCVYSLPGLLDYEATWCEKGRLNEVMDTLIAHGQIGEMVVVMPDKDNVSTNPMEEFYFAHYLATDLREYVESNFRVIPVNRHRGVEGLSLGASWALKLATNLPGLYCSVGILSTQFTEESYQDVEENLAELQHNNTRFLLSAGTGEANIIPSNQHFCGFLRERGLDAHFFIEEGPHDWPLWQKVIYKTLCFHYRSFNP
ncbi:alpha/beta hydrolase [Candidatus Riflebacteria bacterium]